MPFRNRQKHFAAALCVVGLLGIPAVAGAQTPAEKPPTAQEKEAARAAMDDGDKKRDSGDLKGALESYDKADGIMHVPTTGIEVARTQIALNMFLEAQVTLARIVKSQPKPGEPAPFTNARKEADKLSKDLDTRIPTILVVPTNVEAGQTPTILIDGQDAAASTTTPQRVNPGAHTVEVKAGTLDKKVDVTVAEHDAKSVTVDVKDQPKLAGPPPAPAHSDLTTGKILTFGGFGVGVVGLGLGTIIGIMSMTKTSDLKDRCPGNKCPAGSQSDIDHAKTLGNISTVGFIVGAVGAGVGVVGLVLMKKEASQEAPPPAAAFRPTELRAVVGPSYAGLAGRF